MSRRPKKLLKQEYVTNPVVLAAKAFGGNGIVHLCQETGATSYQDRDTWLTPREVLDRLGEFDIDPCTPAVMPWRTAKVMLTEKEDGLRTPWFPGLRVWINPPFSNPRPWLQKLAAHGNGIALTANSTDAGWFHEAAEACSAFNLLQGRMTFCNVFGQPAHDIPYGQVLWAFGAENARAIAEFKGYVARRASLP